MTRLATVLLCVAALSARADHIKNENFEQALEVEGDVTHWGEVGEVFGAVSQVAAGVADQPAKASAGRKMIVIDVPGSSWNGLWQEVDANGGKPYAWKANCLIVGELPESVSTFLKVEFYDQYGEQISAIEGEWLKKDTAGAWVESAMKGTTPAGTKKVRYVIIAGDNSGNAVVKNRIYWDNASAQ
jgi:hypothetical protein